MDVDLEKKIESILFFKGEAVSIKKLSKILEVKEKDIKNSLEILNESLSGRGVSIVQANDEVVLVTSLENIEIVDKIRKEELTKNLGRAGIETLTIIMYMGPISKPKIDFIRGVNSVTIIRNLLIRGLIKRVLLPNNKRIFMYEPTVEALSHIGINSVQNLPKYNDTRKILFEFDSDETDASI